MDPSTSIGHVILEASESFKNTKRKRLSHACNYCRSQKKRCDEQRPSCRNCLLANRPCVTVDLRKPGRPAVVRKRARSISASTPGSLANSAEAETYSGPQFSPSTVLDEASVQQKQSRECPEPTDISTGPSIDQVDNIPQTHRISASDLAEQQQQQQQQQQVHAAFNIDDTRRRTKYLGSSSSQVFAQGVDLVLLAQGHRDRLSDGFQHGMRYCEEFDLPLTVRLLPVHNLGNVAPAIDIYFERIQPLNRFADRPFINQVLDKFLQRGEIAFRSAEDASQLACLYAVISSGLLELHHTITPMGTELLEAAYSLISRIIAHPYFEAVRALGAIAVALRGRFRDGAASQLLGQAIRIAVSIGLHRQPQRGQSTDAETYRDVWWSCYCFESNLQFESGRPCMLEEKIVNPVSPVSNPGDSCIDHLRHLMDLSALQNRIRGAIFETNVNHTMEAMMTVIAEFDAKLTEWADTLPDIIRPGRELIYTPSEMLPFAAALALPYYSTLIMIHRTSLLVDKKLYRDRIELTHILAKWKHRILAGESICINAARSIVRIVQEVLTQVGFCQLISPGQSLLALYVLLIGTMRSPRSWVAQSDLELIRRTTSYLQDRYASGGQDPRFVEMIPKLSCLAAEVISKSHQVVPSTRRNEAHTRSRQNDQLPRYSEGHGVISRADSVTIAQNNAPQDISSAHALRTDLRSDGDRPDLRLNGSLGSSLTTRTPIVGLEPTQKMFDWLWTTTLDGDLGLNLDDWRDSDRSNAASASQYSSNYHIEPSMLPGIDEPASVTMAARGDDRNIANPTLNGWPFPGSTMAETLQILGLANVDDLNLDCF